MKDDYGRVLIPGYYDGIEFTDEVAAVLDAVPDDLPMINAKLGIAQTDSVSTTLQRALQYPSLNIKGISSGWVGSETRTIVPATAIAEIDLRLVKESDPHRLIRLIKDYIADQGYYIVDRKPTARERLEHDRICRMSSRVSYEAFRTDFDSRVGQWLTRALTDAFDTTPVRERTMGGSIPISPFVSILDAPAVVVPFANKDNNQHSPNENIRMGNYIDGLRSMYYILSTEVD
jgi:acetylornithine deacetylase/succinyl-diaminopimelate desuccinylase-like protein